MTNNIFTQQVASLLAGKKPHYSEEEMRQEYGDKYFVAFVDILGFRAMIEQDPTGRDFIPVIEKAIQDGLLFAKHFPNLGNPEALNYRVFSDNICFWLPVHYGAFSLSLLLSVVAEFQLAMVFNGVFCRGGVSIGYHYASEHVIYGSAIVDAVELEHGCRNPCAAIAKPIVEDIHLIGMALQLHQYHTLRKEGPWFVNYLWKVFYIEKEQSIRTLEQHHDIVFAKLSEHRDQPQILSKYEWVAQYHNDIVSMITFKDQCPVIGEIGT